ncbi:alpha/beta fold hydrolase [Kribbella sp. NPDC056951]|uniref:alpha/beta fold hydrolase n=1 Tax=Kribbella sp. NPDC056951 TaxID=3345978 RepID=UPI00363B51D0
MRTTAGIWWESTGAGEPVLLINGLGTASTSWFRLLPGLRGYRVITFDNRGVGRTGSSPEPFDLATMATDAVAVLDAADVDRAHILGLSMGGLIAQELALSHPGRASSLILVSTHSGVPHLTVAASAVATTLKQIAGLPPAERSQALAPILYVDQTPAAERARDDEIGDTIPTTPEGMRSQLLAATPWDRHTDLHQLTVPTLVLHGREDRLVPLSAGETLAAAIPNADLVIIPNAGHRIFTDQTTPSTQAITTFLHQVTQTRSPQRQDV